MKSVVPFEGELDPSRCHCLVISSNRWVTFNGRAMRVEDQCSRKNGHGPNGIYCLQHKDFTPQSEPDRRKRKAVATAAQLLLDNIPQMFKDDVYYNPRFVEGMKIVLKQVVNSENLK